MKYALRCINLSKNFSKRQILKNINFSVRQGERLAIIGQNGAGKSVLLNCLLGLLKPDNGEIKIFGKNLEENRRQLYQKINFASSNHSLQLHSTPFENLYTYALLYGVKDPSVHVKKLSKDLDIEKLVYCNKKMISLSSGQASKIILCKALLNDPKLLILDEYSTFFDPLYKIFINKYIRALNEEKGTTIIMTSHQLSEVREMCTSVVILKAGVVSYINNQSLPKKLTSYL